MKRLIPLLFAFAWHVSAHAADPLPAHVAGSWGSAQTVMYLQADGDGLMAGAAPPATGADNARPIIGFPVRAALDGDTLNTHGTRMGRPHVLIEIRQDLVADGEMAAAFALRLKPVLDAALEDMQSIHGR